MKLTIKLDAVKIRIFLKSEENSEIEALAAELNTRSYKNIAENTTSGYSLPPYNMAYNYQKPTFIASMDSMNTIFLRRSKSLVVEAWFPLKQHYWAPGSLAKMIEQLAKHLNLNPEEAYDGDVAGLGALASRVYLTVCEHDQATANQVLNIINELENIVKLNGKIQSNVPSEIISSTEKVTPPKQIPGLTVFGSQSSQASHSSSSSIPAYAAASSGSAPLSAAISTPFAPSAPRK